MRKRVLAADVDDEVVTLEVEFAAKNFVEVMEALEVEALVYFQFS